MSIEFVPGMHFDTVLDAAEAAGETVYVPINISAPISDAAEITPLPTTEQ